MSFDKKLITPENRLLVTVFISIVAILLISITTKILLGGLIDNIELKSYDWRAQRAVKDQKKPSDVVLLVVDDISLQNVVSNPEIGLSRWPWPRGVQADIIKYLENAGVKAIVYDIIFEGTEGNNPYNVMSDDAFVNQVKQTDNIDFAVSFSYPRLSFESYSENKEFYKQNILNISSQKLKDEIKKFAIFPKVVDVNDQLIKNIEFYNVSNILSGLLNNAKTIGAVSLPKSSDGIFRMIRPLSIFDGNYYPGLPLSVLLALKPETKLKLDKNDLYINDIKIQLDENGSHNVNWYGAPGSFKYYRALDVYLAQKVKNEGKADPLNPANFKDKVVVIGLTATGTDILPTPMSSAYPGPEFVATAIQNYLSGDTFITKISDFNSSLILIAFCLLVGIIVILIKSGFKSISLSIVVLVLYIFLCIHLYMINNLWLEMVYPSLTILFTIMITFMCKYVTTRKAYEDTFKLATTDGLTGLYNHRYFQESLSVVLQRANRYKHQFSILIIDIDNFKKVNDTYGHRAGDKVLKEVAVRLLGSVRQADFLARYGGEEIVAILNNTSYEQAMLAANKLISVINSSEFKLKSDLSIPITISVGIAEYPRHAQTKADLIEIADQGLYMAKHDGKNKIGFIEYKQSTLDEVIDVTKFNELLLKIDDQTYNKLQELANTNNKQDLTRWILAKIKDIK